MGCTVRLVAIPPPSISTMPETASHNLILISSVQMFTMCLFCVINPSPLDQQRSFFLQLCFRPTINMWGFAKTFRVTILLMIVTKDNPELHFWWERNKHHTTIGD